MLSSTGSRSFVIPVLDMSPASPYNIVKLLADLENIQGDVIVVFNSAEMAERLKTHPRITYYAVMSENVGVARAWNIGLNISQSEVTFILNSDLHLTPEAADQMERYLYELPEVAIVGPQGSYFNFNTVRDLHYFDKGSFKYPIEVDAVSGFLFAVRTSCFHSGTLIFDNRYSPCYFEEWDTGIQVKLAGLKSYIVPVTEYEHEWSGSIKALGKIKYLNKEESKSEIYQRNLALFREKWSSLSQSSLKVQSALESLWIDILCKKAAMELEAEKVTSAQNIYNRILSEYPDNRRIQAALSETSKLI